MLCIERKVGERLVIDAHIVIEVLRYGSKKMRLGVTAPESVKVLRQELITNREDHGHDDHNN